MLTIRREQMMAFERDARWRGVLRLAEHLRATCGERVATCGDDQLRAEVEAGEAHARRYGIEAEDDVKVFLECRVELGADFDVREAWAAAVLTDESLFPEEKASFLADRHVHARFAGGVGA